jgi:APA family basic amino acid/polyamine antiporter
VNAFLGPVGGSAVSFAVLVSTFGTVNGMILSGPRVTFAMARDGIFFERFGGVHPRFRTPHAATVIQGLWASLLTLSGRYDQLFTYVIFAAWFFYAMTAAAVLVLRSRRPDCDRPVKTWGYPWIPLCFIAAAAYLVVNTLITDPRDSLMGLAMMVLGLPVYAFYRRKKKRSGG